MSKFIFVLLFSFSFSQLINFQVQAIDNFPSPYSSLVSPPETPAVIINKPNNKNPNKSKEKG